MSTGTPPTFWPGCITTGKLGVMNVLILGDFKLFVFHLCVCVCVCVGVCVYMSKIIYILYACVSINNGNNW